jgi:hypothetical protein
MSTNHDIAPKADPESESRRPSGGLTVSLWLLAIILAQYLVICWVVLRAY